MIDKNIIYSSYINNNYNKIIDLIYKFDRIILYNSKFLESYSFLFARFFKEGDIIFMYDDNRNLSLKYITKVIYTNLYEMYEYRDILTDYSSHVKIKSDVGYKRPIFRRG